MKQETSQLLAYLARNPSPDNAAGQPPQRYQLLAINPPKALRLVLLGPAVTMGLALAGAFGLRTFSGGWLMGWLLLVLAGGAYIVRHRLKKLNTPLVVTLRAEGLDLQWPYPRPPRLLRYDEIATYRVENSVEATSLHLLLTDASKLAVANNPDAAGSPRLTELVRQFEEQLQARPLATGTVAPLREKSFLEKPAATLLLVLMALIVLAMTGAMLVLKLPWSRSIPTLYFGLAVYTIAWLRARA